LTLIISAIMKYLPKNSLIIPLFFSQQGFQQIKGKFYSHDKVLRLNTVDFVDVNYKSEPIYEFKYALHNSLTFVHTISITKAGN
jgi:hypothetical protein